MEIKITTKKANCEQEVNITCSAEELVIISQQPAFKEFTDLLVDHAKWESAFQRKRMSSRLDVNEHRHDDRKQDSETEAMVQNAEEISRRMDELLKSWNI